VAGEGVLLLSQTIRRAGRVALPIPRPAVRYVGGLVGRRVDASPEQREFINFGRVVDTTRLRTQFPYVPAFSSAEALESLLTERPLRPVVSPDVVRRAESAAGRLLGIDARSL